MKKAIVLILILCACLSGCAANNDAAYEDITTTDIEAFGMVIPVPKDWINEITNDEYIGFSEYSEDGDMLSAMGIYNIPLSDFEGGVSEYVDMQLEYLESLDYIKQLENSTLQIAGKEASIIEYRNSSVSERAMCISAIFSLDHKIISISFYSESSQRYEYFKDMLNEIELKQ